MSFEKHHDKDVPLTDSDRLKTWQEAKGATMGYCDWDGCAGKQTIKRFSLTAAGSIFLCQAHFKQSI